MRNLIIGFLILAAGAWYLSGPGTIRTGFGLKGPGAGSISGYAGAPSAPVSATRGAAGAILK